MEQVVKMGGQSNAGPVIIKRKKVKGGDGHHGGAWKVAYADFVTAMMAFFLLMWLLNATTVNQRKGLADYFTPTVPVARMSGGGDGALSGDSIFSEDVLPRVGTGATSDRPTESREARGDSGLDPEGQAGADSAENAALLAVQQALMGPDGSDAQDDPLRRHIVVRLSDEGLVIELFDIDDATLFDGETATPTPLLSELAAMLGRVLPSVENAMAMQAHVAAQPLVRSDNTVWRLSTARADMLRALLEGHGVVPARLSRVTGHADRRPITGNPMDSRNNRLEVILLRKGY